MSLLDTLKADFEAALTWVENEAETVPAGAAFLNLNLYCPSFAGTVYFSDPYVGQPH